MTSVHSFRNQNLSGENGDVFALTSAIVGALECLQMQQSQLEESKAEQKTLLNQLGREKNSREEFELVNKTESSLTEVVTKPFHGFSCFPPRKT